MNKILLLQVNPTEAALIEEMLYEVVRAGAELFVVHSKEQALLMFKREQPQLLLIDEELLLGEEHFWEEYPLIVLRKPIDKQKLRTECYALLDQSRQNSRILPM